LLGSAVAWGSFLNQEEDLPFVRLRRRHELPNRIEDDLDLLVGAPILRSNSASFGLAFFTNKRFHHAFLPIEVWLPLGRDCGRLHRGITLEFQMQYEAPIYPSE
jgi:hypothetical protein